MPDVSRGRRAVVDLAHVPVELGEQVRAPGVAEHLAHHLRLAFTLGVEGLEGTGE